MATRLDHPATQPVAYAVFAHCFTCSKDGLAAFRTARGARLARSTVRIGRRFLVDVNEANLGPAIREQARLSSVQSSSRLGRLHGRGSMGAEPSVTAEHREFLDATLPHLGVVQNLARRCAADPSHAEDLVQETYLRAFAAWPPRQDGSVRAWLAAICLNTARSGGRRLARRPVETPMADAGVEYAGSQDVSEAALSAAAYKAALRAIDGLAEPKRVALVLVDVAGLTAHEAAEALGVPRGTILARVHRARREVAAALDREGVEP